MSSCARANGVKVSTPFRRTKAKPAKRHEECREEHDELATATYCI
jgi:hypothetical protein